MATRPSCGPSPPPSVVTPGPLLQVTPSGSGSVALSVMTTWFGPDPIRTTSFASVGLIATPMYVSDWVGAKFGTVANWLKSSPAVCDRHTPSSPLVSGSDTTTYTVLGLVGATATS